MLLVNHNNSLYFNDSHLIIEFKDETFIYQLEEINKISILTTAKRVANDRVFLTFDVKDNVYLLPLKHPEFEDVLFNQLKPYFEIDYADVSMAILNNTDKEFVLFKK